MDKRGAAREDDFLRRESRLAEVHLPAAEPEHIVHLRDGAAGWSASDDFGRGLTECEVVALRHDVPVCSGVSIDGPWVSS